MIGPGWSRLVASCFGVGMLRLVPGTLGSLLGLGLYVFLLVGLPLWGQALAVLAASVIGIVAADQVTVVLGQTDPSEVVIDELAGMWLGLVGTTEWKSWALAFLLFRALDVLKPYPANRFEALPGGWGIMCDDLVAGLYTLAIVTVASRFFLGG